MSNRKTTFVVTTLASLFVSVPSFAQVPTHTPCVLQDHHITAITPYQVDEHMGKVPVRRLRGANVFIQAEPGLTAEWLELTLTKHIAAMRSSAMTDCALDIDDVTVQVSSTGAGFAVRIAAHDSDKAKEILRRVRLPR